MPTIIIVISIMTQLSAAVYALTLMAYTGKRAGWILISTALFMMAGRRGVTLYDILVGTKLTPTNLWAELIALSISILFLAGLVYTYPIFKKLETDEKEKKASDLKYRQMQKSAFEGIFILDHDFIIQENNPSAEKIFSTPAGRLIGKPILSLVPNKYHERVRNELEYIKSSTSKTPELFKKHIEGIKGSKEAFPMDIILSSFSHDGSKQLTVTVRDLSEVMKTREELDTSRKMLQTILDTIPVRVFWKDLNANYLGCNLSFAKDAGYNSVEELIGKDDYQMAWRDNAELYREDDKHVMSTGNEKLNYEEPLIDDMGEKEWIRTSKIPLRDNKGNIYGVMGVYEDITGRKNYEDEIRHTKDLLQAVLDNSAAVIYAKDKDGKYILINHLFETLFSTTLEEITGTTDFDHFPEDKAQAFRTNDLKVLRTKRPMEFEEIVPQKDFDHTYLSIKFPLINAEGEAYATCGISTDITERKRMETSLLERDELLKKAQEIARLGNWELDLETNIFTCYKESCNIFGMENKDGCQGSFEEFLDMIVNDDERDYVNTLFQQAIDEGSDLSLDHKVKSNDVFVHEEAEAVLNKDGKVVKLVGIVQDITERKRIEDELLKGQKLESIGMLAGGIAHDFNNLLTAIIGNLFFLKGNNSDKDDLKHIATIEGASLRAQELTKQLMTFSRGGSPIKDAVSIKELIVESANFALHGSKITHDYKIPDSTHPINADQGQISQVLNNLLINAVQAMGDGGSIYIEAKNKKVKKSDKLFLKPGEYVHISISDTGPGMTTEVQSKIFDPFFTTKSGGSGLGLASCYSIIKKHSGTISTESKLGHGTTFHIYLPALTGKLAKGTKAKIKGKATIKKGSGRILIMDDDGDLRALYKGILEAIGYEVTLTKEGSEAIVEYKNSLTNDTPFDLIIMDLTIPGGIGGKDAIAEVLKINSAAKAIVCSGYSDDPVMANYKDFGFKGVITKPFSTETLSQEVSLAINAKED